MFNNSQQERTASKSMLTCYTKIFSAFVILFLGSKFSQFQQLVDDKLTVEHKCMQ